METLWKGAVYAYFQVNRPELGINCALFFRSLNSTGKMMTCSRNNQIKFGYCTLCTNILKCEFWVKVSYLHGSYTIQIRSQQMVFPLSLKIQRELRLKINNKDVYVDYGAAEDTQEDACSFMQYENLEALNSSRWLKC